jgi:hypothetical protein
MVRVKPHKIGDVVRVHHVPGGYRLPDGLPAGAEVRVVAFDHAYRIVERDGREFRIYMANVDSGLEPCR